MNNFRNVIGILIEVCRGQQPLESTLWFSLSHISLLCFSPLIAGAKENACPATSKVSSCYEFWENHYTSSLLLGFCILGSRILFSLSPILRSQFLTFSFITEAKENPLSYHYWSTKLLWVLGKTLCLLNPSWVLLLVNKLSDCDGKLNGNCYC